MIDFKKKRWFFIVLVAIAYGGVWTFPYMLETYYVPIQKAFGFTNEQLGTIMTIFGIASALLYGPGGFIADRFSVKKLLATSLIGTAVLGATVLTIPPLWIMCVIQFGYGITLVLIMWGALMKFLRMMGDEHEQGKIYGFFFAISGVAGAIEGFGGTHLYDALGQDLHAFKMLLLFYVVCVGVPGLLFAILFNEKEAFAAENDDSGKIEISQLGAIAKMPFVWLLIGLVFFTFFSKSGMVYFQPYLKEFFAVPVATISIIAIIRQQVVRLFTAPVTGIATDKTGSSIKSMGFGIFLGIVAASMMLLTPKAPALAWVIIAALMLTAVYYNICMPSYYIPISEAKIPLKYTGTIVGIVSIIGFSSDMFYYKVCGYLLDTYGEKGYSMIFGTSLVTSFIAIVFAVLLYRHVKKMAASGDFELSE